MSSVPGINNTASFPAPYITRPQAPVHLTLSLGWLDQKEECIGPHPTDLERAMYSCGEEFSKQGTYEIINLLVTWVDQHSGFYLLKG